MNKLMIGIGLLLATSASFTTTAAPYEDYKVQIQRTQEAKLKGGPRTDEPAMAGHMPLMQEMSRQLQEARAVEQMAPEQMRTWITHHVRLMDQMHQQMMGGTNAPSRPAH